MKKIFVILAPGFELIEALTPVDVLRRCKLDTITLSIGDSSEVESSCGVKVIADRMFLPSEALEGDMIVLPGGYPGFVNLGKDSHLMEVVKNYLEAGKFIGAICGAPSILAENNLIDGRKVTAHPGVKDMMGKTHLEHCKVMRDGNLITGAGAGVSLDFALELAKCLVDKETLFEVKKGMEIHL